jgi:hypothetical protein
VPLPDPSQSSSPKAFRGDHRSSPLMFSGLSSLRKDEKKEPTSQNKALQDYLKKYTSDGADDGEKKKKRKKRPKAEQGGAVQIVDADLTGFEAVQAAAERKRAAAARGGPPVAVDGSDEEEAGARCGMSWHAACCTLNEGVYRVQRYRCERGPCRMPANQQTRAARGGGRHSHCCCVPGPVAAPSTLKRPPRRRGSHHCQP